MIRSASILFTIRASLLLALVLPVGAAGAGGPPLHAFTIGPMLHWNFGSGKDRFSWGWEAAYWQSFDPSSGDSPHLHGVDVGIEFHSNTTRIYAEYQQGMVVYGASLGPVVEMRDGGVRYGIQGGVWGAMLLGLDLRARYVQEQGAVFAPGTFLKIPLVNSVNIGN